MALNSLIAQTLDSCRVRQMNNLRKLGQHFALRRDDPDEFVVTAHIPISRVVGIRTGARPAGLSNRAGGAPAGALA